MKSTNKQTAKVETTTKPRTNYQVKVIDRNNSYKAEAKSLGGVIKLALILDKDILTKPEIDFLRKLQKDDKMYAEFSQQVRKSRKGNYSTFYLLQALYKGFNK